MAYSPKSHPLKFESLDRPYLFLVHPIPRWKFTVKKTPTTYYVDRSLHV